MGTEKETENRLGPHVVFAYGWLVVLAVQLIIWMNGIMDKRDDANAAALDRLRAEVTALTVDFRSHVSASPKGTP